MRGSCCVLVRQFNISVPKHAGLIGITWFSPHGSQEPYWLVHQWPGEPAELRGWAGNE